ILTGWGRLGWLALASLLAAGTLASRRLATRETARRLSPTATTLLPRMPVADRRLRAADRVDETQLSHSEPPIPAEGSTWPFIAPPAGALSSTSPQAPAKSGDIARAALVLTHFEYGYVT